MRTGNTTKEAGFLQGALITGFTGSVLSRPGTAGAPIVPGGLALAGGSSETTLTCWEQCTKWLSGC